MERLTLKSLETAVNTLPGLQGMLLEKAVLLSAFSLVENKADPRGPIKARINADLCEVEPDVIVRAVQFFTATTPKVEVHGGVEGGIYEFTSEGYRAGPAGDH
jgi:hypothetical protein